MDAELQVLDFPDYPNALNGLQVSGRGEVSRVAAAVDSSEATIAAAIAADADLLVVHHGLFWGGVQPLRGSVYRKLSAIMTSGLSIYSAHLPLDAHPDLGNCAILAGELGIEVREGFGSFQGRKIGWMGHLETDREDLQQRLQRALGADVKVVPGGPDRVSTVAVVTGAGGSFLAEAATAGVDTLVTGEAGHHSYHDAMELRINLLLGGHYATETWGVKALAERVADTFEIEWAFLDLPTGM